MEKYYFKNWKTYPFKKKSFNGQLDRFAKVCIVSVEKPNEVIDIIPIYGENNDKRFESIIKLIHDIELNIPLDIESKKLLNTLQRPIVGQFEEFKSLHGPLFHQFTPDEAEYGLCSERDVWKPERDENGNVKEYNAIKVFTMYSYDSEFGSYYINPEFTAQKMYYKYLYYRYKPISMLNEPTKL